MPQNLPAYEHEVLSVVREAVADHGLGAATVSCEWVDGAQMWFINVAPERIGAAHVSIGVMADELVLWFGRTRAELWMTKRGPSPLDQLRQFLPAILAGRFEEAGRSDDRFTRVELVPGKYCSVGAAHLPIPWSMRRHRYRYLSYS